MVDVQGGADDGLFGERIEVLERIEYYRFGALRVVTFEGDCRGVAIYALICHNGCVRPDALRQVGGGSIDANDSRDHRVFCAVLPVPP